MFRRSRFSARPNIGTAGRAATGTSQEATAGNQETNEIQKEPKEGNNASLADNPDVTPSENASGIGDASDQNVEGTSSSASVQRRKRFSIKPKVAPGRPPALPRTLTSTVKTVSVTPADAASESEPERPSTSSQPTKTPAPPGLPSPRRRKLSENAKQHKTQPKLTQLSEKPGPSAVSPSEDSPKETHLLKDGSKQVENVATSQAKEVHPRVHDRVPPSLPDKESTEISEKAKTLISKKVHSVISPSALSLSRLLNDPSDVQRMIKAQKLRELLRQERCKEKKIKRTKARPKEFSLDPTKMTMRDLIHYLPTSNPMTSTLEPDEENETVIPPSPRGEQSTEHVPEVPVIKGKSGEEEEEAEAEAAAEEEEDESLMVPQVKVAEDGSLIIDEESLTVEVQRAKGPNPASNRDPIFERGSTTTYSSFRKSTYSKPWSIEETDMFYLAVSMVGTDFSMICQLFPHRARTEIKNKFKKEERENSWRVDKAFRERRNLDIEYFSKLLDKILEYQKEKKKLKSLVEKNNKTKSRRNTKVTGKKSIKKLSDVEEEEDDILDLEEGQEKENEDQCNEDEASVSELNKKRKRKKKVEALTEEPNEKKNKTADMPEDSEAVLPESHISSEMSENIPNVNRVKDPSIKPAKLSRDRAPKPLLPLGLKRNKKGKNEEKNDNEEAHKEQANEGESDACRTSERISAGDEISSEEEEATIKHFGPTRYGRVPKPTVVFACKDESHSSAAEANAASPSASKSKPKGTLKRGKPQSNPTPKKSKLVTLRSSKSDFSDEEDEEGHVPGFGSSNDISALVSSGLHSVNTVISEVDDPMAELYILASVPDMLSISQDALCPDSSCYQAQHETGSAEAHHHQSDLLVDVIDFCTTEQTEASRDESYNEAAQTLLTIGNVAHVSQSAQTKGIPHGSTSGITVDETDHSDGRIEPSVQEEMAPTILPTDCPKKLQEVTEAVGSMKPQTGEMSSGDASHLKTTEQIGDEQKTVHDEESGSHIKSKTLSSSNSPSTKRARFSKVKPKPNIGRTSRTAVQSSETAMSKEQKVEESGSDAPAEGTPAVEKTTLHRTDPEALMKDGELFKEVQGCSVSSEATSATHKNPSITPQDGIDEMDSSNSLKSKSEGTQILQEPSTFSDSVQDGNIKHPPPEKDLSANQKNMGAAPTRRSRLSKVKPNLPQITRATSLNKLQTSKETEKKEPQTRSDLESSEEAIKDVENSSCSFNLTEEPPAEEAEKKQVEVEPQAEHPNTPNVQSSSEQEPEQGSNAELTADPEVSCSAAVIPPVEERPAGKQESTAPPAGHLRRSRFLKVKPKPNLTQTSRAIKAKSLSTGETTVESPGSLPELHTESTLQVPLQTPSTSTSEQQLAATGCALHLNPLLALDSIDVLKEKSSANEEEKTSSELVDQKDIEGGSDQSATANQNFTPVPVEQNKKQTTADSESVSKLTNKDLVSPSETSENSCNDAMTSNIVPTSFDLDPVQDQQGQSAVFVRPEELSICKQDSETVEKPRRNRVSKLKSKPNIPQTSRAARLKSETSENQSEKQANPEQKVKELEPTPAFSEMPNKDTDPPSDLTLPPAYVRPLEVKETQSDHQAGMDAAASDTNEQKSTISPELHAEQESTSVENLITTHTSLITKSIQALTDSTVKESQCGQESNLNSEDAPERRGHPEAEITASEEPPVIQKEDKMPSVSQVKRSRSQKPKPNLSKTSRPARSKPEEKAEVQCKLELQQTTEEEAKVTEANLTPQDGASERMNVAPTGDSALTRLKEIRVSNTDNLVQDQTEPMNVGKQPVGDQQDEKSNAEKSTSMQVIKKPPSPPPEEKRETEQKTLTDVGQVSTSVVTDKSTLPRRQRFPKPKPNVKSSCGVRKLQSDVDSRTPKGQIEEMPSAVLSEQQADSPKKAMSDNYPADHDSLSSGDGSLDMPSPNTQTVAPQTAITDVPSTSNASPSPLRRGSSVRGSDLTPSELTDSSKAAGKANRGRLIKPKPNLRCISRLQKTQAVGNTQPTGSDSDHSSHSLSTFGDHKPPSELGAKTQYPEKGVIKKTNEKDTSSQCDPKEGSSNEHQTSSTEGIQRHSLLSELLPEQVPSDPDEPFFILSLIEIPVSSAREVEMSAVENPAATAAFGHQSSASGVSLVSGDHPELPVESVAITPITEPSKTIGDDVADKKTCRTSKAKASTSDLSNTTVAESKNPPTRKAATTRNKGKAPSGASQMSSSGANASTSNYSTPTQTKSPTSVAGHINLTSSSTALTSPERESGFVDEEPTSVSQFFLSDIFTKVEEE